jgi:hypothetical protein
MSSESPESDGLEETLESARRNVRQLEMDTYRVRSDLTRLEVVLEAVKTRGIGVADREPHAGDDDVAERANDREVYSAAESASPAAPNSVEPSIEATSGGEFKDSTSLAVGDWIGETDDVAEMPAVEQDFESAVDFPIESTAILPNRSIKRARRVTPSVAASLALHGAVILAIFSITVATIGRSEPTFTTTILDLGEKPPESEENFDLGQFSEVAIDDSVVQAADVKGLQADVPGPIVSDVIPVGFESIEGPPNAGEAGIDAPPTDAGTMPAGAGGARTDGKGTPSGTGSGQKRGTGSGARGGTGSALFFGTQTKGDRFVFVVDNSSSMKGGRLEMALTELVKTVEGLTPRQSFYVIFVSDQPYPMFYPQTEPALMAATPQNKNRLREWLPKAILASGHNREMIKAMDMAAALGPQAVYLLWDGDLKYSDNVRLDVMSHLTQTPWNFVVHTVGLGITSLDGEQNLTVIAQAHHGQYRRVEVPKLRSR